MTYYLRPIGFLGLLLLASLMFFPGMGDYRIPVLSLLLIVGISGAAIYGYRINRQLSSAMATTHQTLAALKEAERKLRVVADNMYDWEYWIDPDGRFLYCSSSCLPVTGHAASAFIADPALLERIIHPDDRAAYAEHERAAPVSGHPVEIHFRILRTDGTERWIAHMCRQVFDENDVPLGRHGSNRDITERRQVEEKLREREALFSKIFRHSPVLMTISDVKSGCYIDVNEKFVEVSGFTREEAVGKSSIELGWISRPERERISAQLKKGDALASLELSLTTKDKRSIQCTYAGTTIIVDGHPFLLSLAEDVTERKRIEARLQESERRYDQLSELSRTIAWEVDAEGLYTYVSHVAKTVLGYAPAEMEGAMHFYDLHPEEGREAYKAAAFDVFARHETFVNLVNEAQAKGGGRVWLSTNGFPLLDARGALLGYRGADVDISENQRHEEERQKLQLQLVQAQKMESVGRLAGGVAHDFNNMLQVILGYVELAVEGMDSAQPLYSDLMEIRSAAQRSVALTQQLLAFARKQVIAPRVLDLDQTVGRMLSMLHRLIGEDIELVWTPGAGGAAVRMDPSQVDQVLTNLVVNARAAIAGVGTVTIACRTATVDAVDCAGNADAVPGEYVMLEVGDTGCGMDAATLEHLFEPFFTTKGFGTGLGLSTVYGILKQNNGFVNVRSEPGKGTTFKLYLPRQGEAAEPSVMNSTVPLATSQCESILLVEDELALLTIGKKMLEGLGYRVLAAATPAEALRLAAAHASEIDLLITDVVMPGLSGRDLAKRLTEQRPELRCIFMSGYTANIIEERGVLAKDLHFLPKPFTLSQLANLVRTVLSRAPWQRG